MKATPAGDSAASPLAAPRRAGPSSRNAVTDPHLKDVYAAWLKDLDEDNSAKVVTSLRRKASREESAAIGTTKTSKATKKQQLLLAHALQPTEASASKHISQRQEPKLPLLVAHAPSREAAASSLEEAQQRRHQSVANEANCANYEYRTPFQPGLAFFKLLVHAAIQGSRSTPGTATAAAAKYEVPSFPVRVPPTLLRFGSSSSPSSSSDQFRLALLFTHEASDHSAVRAVPGGGSSEDTSSFVLFVQVYATERQYRDQRKALLRLFITHDTGCDHQPQPNSSSTSTVMAVSKLASENCKSNATFLLRTAEDVEVAIDRLWNGTLQSDTQQQQQQNTGSGCDDDSDCAIQKYIPYKGSSAAASSKAWLARPVYRKKDKASWIWILTDSGNSGMTDSSCHDSCQIVKCIAAQSWSAPRMLASTCAHFFENLLSVSMTELALDLTQDADGRWRLLQVKAFQLRCQRPKSSSGAAPPAGSVDHENRVKSAPNRLESAGLNHSLAHRKWRCAGQHCSSTGDGTGDTNSEDAGSPSGYLTKKVLLSCDFYDKFMAQQDMSVTSGFANFSAALSFHLQHQISKRDRNQLYEPQPLCSNCITKYHFVREQWVEATIPTATTTAAKHFGTGNAVMKARKARQLPSLQSAASTSLLVPSSSGSSNIPATMKSSNSAPAFLLGSRQPTNLYQASTTTGGGNTSSGHSGSGISNSRQQHNSSSSDRPVYLSEMEKIEEMLTQHDTKFPSSQSKKNQHSECQSDRERVSLGIYEADAPGDDNEASQFSSFLHKRSEADSVEEMWKSISLKPLGSSTGATRGDNRPKVPYNSYSLSHELKRQQQQLERVNSDPTSHNAIDGLPTKAAPKELQPLNTVRPEDHQAHLLKGPSAATTKLTMAAAVHTIAISDCKQVFYDETYRERVVDEAKENLVHRNRSVRLMVVPPSIPRHACSSESGQKAGEDADNQELAEMVLRSLFLDLSQFATETSLRAMPTISRESSGCTTMLLVASSHS